MINSVTLRSSLQDLKTRVETVAQSKNRSWSAHTISLVFLAVANTASRHQNKLDKTIATVNNTVSQYIAALKLLVSALEGNDVSFDLLYNVKQYISQLPMHPHQPKLTQLSALIYSPFSQSVKVKCSGNFEDCGQQEYPIFLTIGDMSFNPIDSNRDTLTFELPTHVLPPPVESQIIFHPASLSVKWKNTGYFSSGIETAKFDLLLHIYPTFAATFFVDYTSIVTTQRCVSYTSPSYTALGNYPETEKIHIFKVEPPDGWTIVPGSTRFVQERNKTIGSPRGKWSKEIYETLSAITCKVTCSENKAGSTRVDFHIEFQQVCIDQYEKKRLASYALGWNEIMPLRVDSNEERISNIRYRSFNGLERVCGIEECENDLFKIFINSGQYYVQTKATDDS